MTDSDLKKRQQAIRMKYFTFDTESDPAAAEPTMMIEDDTQAAVERRLEASLSHVRVILGASKEEDNNVKNDVRVTVTRFLLDMNIKEEAKPRKDFRKALEKLAEAHRELAMALVDVAACGPYAAHQFHDDLGNVIKLAEKIERSFKEIGQQSNRGDHVKYAPSPLQGMLLFAKLLYLAWRPDLPSVNPAGSLATLAQILFYIATGEEASFAKAVRNFMRKTVTRHNEPRSGSGAISGHSG